MKQKSLITVCAFFAQALTGITVSPVITDEASFFSVPEGETIATHRSFHAEILESGENEDQNVAVGSGDFKTYTSAYDLEPNWIVNTKYDFTLSYDSAGNLTLLVDGIGMTDPLVYQPLNAIKQIFIGNDNDSGDSVIQGMEMTNIVFSSGPDVLVFPDLITTPSTFKGLTVSDFGETWNISGTIEFTSPEGGALQHDSSFKFYGAAAAITEPNPDIKVIEMSLAALDEVYFEKLHYGYVQASYAWKVTVKGGWTDSPHYEVMIYRPETYTSQEALAHHNWGSKNGEVYPFSLVYEENGRLTFSMAGAQPYSSSTNVEYDFDEIWIELHNAYENFDDELLLNTFVRMYDVSIDGTSIGEFNASNTTDLEQGAYGWRVYRIWGFENAFEMTGLISLSAEGVSSTPNNTDQVIRIIAPQSTGAQPTPISVSIAPDENGVTIDYSGILQASDTLEGPWDDVIPQPAKSSAVPTDKDSKFFRARE